MNSLKKWLVRSICILSAGSCFVYGLNCTGSLNFIGSIEVAAAESNSPQVAFTNVSAKAGTPLNVSLKNISATDISYSWTVGDKKISDTSSSYTPTEDDYEKMITVTVTADKNTYSASLYFSELPVVYINTTDGSDITSKEEYVDAECTMQGNSEFSDSSQLYSGSIQIRGRGNYTWEHDKKPYKIKLDTKTDVLGMGSNKHWVLIAEYMDPTHVRNEIIPELSEALGMEYTAESQAVILVLNGEYNGLYHLSENVRIGSERVNIYDWEETAEDIAKAVYKSKKSSGMTKDERDELEDYLTQHLEWVTSGSFTWNSETYTVSDYVTLPDGIDGGYLLELDTYDYYHTEQVSDFETDGDQPVQFKSPEYAVTNDEMYNYAVDYIQSFENAVSSDDFYADYDGTSTHYSQLFDMDSLVQYWLFLEVITNSDGMRYSNYMYKDFGEIFKMGPTWDYDWTWNAGYTVPTNEWWTDQSYYNDSVHWYKYLVTDPYFITKAYELYQQVEPTLTEVYADGGKIDTYSEKLKKSAEADLTKWHSRTSFSSEVSSLKTYVKSRYTWLDEQFASVENLAESLGYEASDKLEVSDISADNGMVRITAEVNDSSAKSVSFHVNGIYVGSATVSGGKATLEVSRSYLESDGDSLNTVQIRMLDSNGNYIAASSKSNNNNQGGWQNPWQQQETTTTQVGSLVYSNFSVFTANDLGISGSVKGDVNADGKFDVSDVVMMQTWIINAGSITDWTAGDFDGDNSLSVFDLAMMKNELF
jgi:hypothetical protein